MKSLIWVIVQPSITYASIKNTRLILRNQIPKHPFHVSVHLVEPPFVLKFSHHFVHYLIKQLSELTPDYATPTSDYVSSSVVSIPRIFEGSRNERPTEGKMGHTNGAAQSAKLKQAKKVNVT